MTENLQETKTPVEGAEATSKEELKPTQKEPEPTVGKFTQEDVNKAVGKGLSSIQQQLSLSNAEKDRIQAEAEQHKAERAYAEAERDLLRQQLDTIDDPEVREALLDKRKRLEDDLRAKKRDTDFAKREEAVQKAEFESRMNRKAAEVMQSTGIPLEGLKGCATEHEIELRGDLFKAKKAAEKETPPTPPVDSGVSTAGGVDWRGLSPDDKIRRGTNK